MIPKNLKDWNFVKDKPHDISGITYPDIYYYQCNNGIYYPVVLVRDFQSMRNNKR